MSDSEVVYKYDRVLHQIYETGLGFVRDGIYYRRQGIGHELGPDAPFLYVVAASSAPPRGRPPKGVKYRDYLPRTMAYAIDAQGKWHSITWQDPGAAKARTVSGAPYAKLGRKRVGWLPAVKEEGRRALSAAMAAYRAQRDSDAAWLADAQARCDLI